LAKKRVASVAASWDRLHRWFDRNLPELRAELRPGAPAVRIERFERATRRTLPDDVRASLRIHDGQRSPCRTTGCVYGLGLMSLRHMLDIWELNRRPPDDGAVREGMSSHPAGAVQPCRSHPGWVPLTHDWGGNYLGVDLAPGLKGTWGQVIVFGHSEHRLFVVADSWAAFLTQYYHELRTGNGLVERPPGERVVFRPRSPDVHHYHEAVAQRYLARR
jgi:cell wall assembly regulator SMI1